ncbi:MAG: hypothetical protein IKO84_00180 [Butyrivibrio sp.]|nr:hypothetical protein [Butyrivibrio sp.]
MIISGCTFSSAGGADFEEKYAAAKEKYDKYLQSPVSGQEVLSLIDYWDEESKYYIDPSAYNNAEQVGGYTR